MAHEHWRGVSLPDPADGILSSLETAADTAGLITPLVGDIAAARALVASALAAGAPISAARPAYLDVGGILYRATGEQVDGVLRLAPVSEVESAFDTFRGGRYQRQSGAQSALVTSKLPARPYDRTIVAFGMADATVSGTAGLRLLVVDNSQPVTARWEDNSTYETQTTFTIARVPAGVDPKVILAVSFGGASGKVSTVQFSEAADVNKLAVLAFPVSMG